MGRLGPLAELGRGEARTHLDHADKSDEWPSAAHAGGLQQAEPGPTADGQRQVAALLVAL